MDTKEIKVLEKQVMPLIEQANAFPQILNADDMKEAVTLTSNLGRYYDQIVETREKITKPLNASLKAVRDMFNPFEKPTEAAYKLLRSRVSDYQTEQSRIASEEAEKIAARTGEGKGHYKPETAVRKMGEIEKPEEAVSTDAGTMKFRTSHKLVITDETKIPRHYLMVNEKLLLEDMKKGVSVYGAELQEVQVPVNYR